MKQRIEEALAQVIRIRGFAWASECAPDEQAHAIPVLADNGGQIGAIGPIDDSLEDFALMDAIQPLDSAERTALLGRQWEVERKLIEAFERVATREDAQLVLIRSNLDDDDVEDLDALRNEGVEKPSDENPASITHAAFASRRNQAVVARTVAEYVLDVSSPIELIEVARELNQTRERVLVDSIRLAASVAKRYRGSLPWELAFANASGALLQALDRFDPTKGFQFSTYAQWWIRHRVSRARSSHAHAIRLPVHAEDALFRFLRFERELERERGTRPALAEVLAHGALPQDLGSRIPQWRRPVVRLAIHSENGIRPTADVILDAQLPAPAQGGLRAGWVERFEMTLFELMAGATGKGDTRVGVLRRRLGLGRAEVETLKEIGDEKGVSRERIRQVEAESLRIARSLIARRQDESGEPWDWWASRD